MYSVIIVLHIIVSDFLTFQDFTYPVSHVCDITVSDFCARNVSSFYIQILAEIKTNNAQRYNLIDP